MDAVQKTLGPQTGADVLSNDGLSLDQITESIRSLLGDSPCVLFVDTCGGSPYVACRTLRLDRPLHALVSGLNLPMLYSFFTKRDKLPFADLVRAVETDGHRGIQLILE
jgi:mannose/fructose-specific phosphotransferase system component IIA